MLDYKIDHFFLNMAIWTGKFNVFLLLNIPLIFYNMYPFIYSFPLLIKATKSLSDSSIPICESGAFCYHTTTTYQPDSSASHSNLLNKWKFDLTFAKGSPFSFKAWLGRVIRFASWGLPQTVNPNRQFSAAKLCRFFKVLTGSSTIMITRLAIILSNLWADSMGSSALAALTTRLCMLDHSSSDYFTPILSRYFLRLRLVSSTMLSHRSVAV